jgi:hypothetical protein
MPNWSVQLTGDTFDLKDLPKWFTNPDLRVVEESDGYYLRSDRFEAYEKAGQVRALAQDMLERLVGAAKLERSNFRPIKQGSIVRKDDDGRMDRHVFLEGVINGVSKVSVKKLGSDGTEETPQAPRPGIWAAIAEYDEKVHQALRFWAKDPDDWGNLFKIWEVIESDLGSDIFRHGWASKKEVERFTHTANSPEALGDEARHAKKRGQPPAKPMTIGEAKQLINGLLVKWIETKTLP